MSIRLDIEKFSKYQHIEHIDDKKNVVYFDKKICEMILVSLDENNPHKKQWREIVENMGEDGKIEMYEYTDKYEYNGTEISLYKRYFNKPLLEMYNMYGKNIVVNKLDRNLPYSLFKMSNWNNIDIKKCGLSIYVSVAKLKNIPIPIITSLISGFSEFFEKIIKKSDKGYKLLYSIQKNIIYLITKHTNNYDIMKKVVYDYLFTEINNTQESYTDSKKKYIINYINTLKRRLFCHTLYLFIKEIKKIQNAIYEDNKQLSLFKPLSVTKTLSNTYPLPIFVYKNKKVRVSQMYIYIVMIYSIQKIYNILKNKKIINDDNVYFLGDCIYFKNSNNINYKLIEESLNESLSNFLRSDFKVEFNKKKEDDDEEEEDDDGDDDGDGDDEEEEDDDGDDDGDGDGDDEDDDDDDEDEHDEDDEYCDDEEGHEKHSIILW